MIRLASDLRGKFVTLQPMMAYYLSPLATWPAHSLASSSTHDCAACALPGLGRGHQHAKAKHKYIQPAHTHFVGIEAGENEIGSLQLLPTALQSLLPLPAAS